MASENLGGAKWLCDKQSFFENRNDKTKKYTTKTKQPFRSKWGILWRGNNLLYEIATEREPIYQKLPFLLKVSRDLDSLFNCWVMRSMLNGKYVFYLYLIFQSVAAIFDFATKCVRHAPRVLVYMKCWELSIYPIKKWNDEEWRWTRSRTCLKTW